MSKHVHVVLAIIINEDHQVLVSRRNQNVHLGGLWEFPGGKVEPGELPFDALKREMHEELGVSISQATPYKKIKHTYTDISVMLDVWQVTAYSGEPRGAEGQIMQWQAIKTLNINKFPQANVGLIQSLQLPDQYMITGYFENIKDFELKLQQSLAQGISLVQLRSKFSTQEDYKSLIKISASLCKQYNANLLLNTNIETFNQMGSMSNGLHLSGTRLHACETRPVNEDTLLSVSCHTRADIEKAKQLQANIILLSPVKATTSHPGVKGIGWKTFGELVGEFNRPVYALGGMTPTDLSDAKSSGAQGIAAISSFWK